MNKKITKRILLLKISENSNFLNAYQILGITVCLLDSPKILLLDCISMSVSNFCNLIQIISFTCGGKD